MLKSTFITKYASCQNGENAEDLAGVYEQARSTDLASRVNKACFYERSQYALRWTLSSPKAEIPDEFTVTPAIPLHGEPLDP